MLVVCNTVQIRKGCSKAVVNLKNNTAQYNVLRHIQTKKVYLPLQTHTHIKCTEVI